MNTARPSRDVDHFDRLYAGAKDPWQLRSSPYERAKYAATMAALPVRRYRACLEVGCSIGELTRLIGKRCEAVHGLDIAKAPLEQAELRCADLPNVRFSQMAVPARWPPGQFDLIMLSEILYFLSVEDVRALARRVCQSLTLNGIVMLVNYLGETDDPASGDEAAESFITASAPDLRADFQLREPRYRLDRLVRAA